MSIEFPSPRTATPEGLVAVGGNLGTETLLAAYRRGIFPWPQPGYPLLWFSPDPRGVLDMADFHVPDSLQKFARKNPAWTFSYDKAFAEVIRACRLQKRPEQEGTWILPEIQRAYTRFHEQGFAHSLEVWDEQGVLVGGIYGVIVDGLFSGESMFYHKPNASKMALWKMVEHLRSAGHSWIDIQMVTPVTAAFGGKYITREEFLTRRGIK